jgi:squalene-hopene/tetraprenyl-beta-curcumene cyclase
MIRFVRAAWGCGLLSACVAVGVAGPAVSSSIQAEDEVTLANVREPAANRADEPLAKQFSLPAAVHFLDSAALDWQKQRQCFTCHTNYAYLYARPAVAADGAAHATVRRFAEELVRDRWPDKGPRWDAEVVATAAALAFNDAATTGELHPLTRVALDRIWTLQREDGGWNWLRCDWPPMESDDHYGATLALIAAGVAPGSYAETDAAKSGIAKARAYLRANPPPGVHHQTMLLWASTYVDELISAEERKATIEKLWGMQRPDGGWNLASLGRWNRQDGSSQDHNSSDGYATGFVTYVLRVAGVPADDVRLKKSVAWLKTNQRESGRWFTRSLFKDNRHFISHAGTAFAVMAIAAESSNPVGKPRAVSR